MLQIYRFTCTCKACEYDYPLQSGLKIYDGPLGRFCYNEIVPFLSDPSMIDNIKPQKAWISIFNYAKKIEETLRKFKYQQPTFEVVVLQLAITYLLQKVGDAPFKFPGATQ